MTVDSDNDTRTLVASLRHVKPEAKPSYEYKHNYSSFMHDCTKLATAVQNRHQVAEAVHGTLVTLMRLAQGQESKIDIKPFHMRSLKAPMHHLEQKDEFTLAQVLL
jgi:hypothetical protein